MEEQLHYISEVSRIVGVEPHVLRYWEEELHLQIVRNSQGKRCYTQRDIRQLRRIKYWKDKGMQLKAVKEMMEEETLGDPSEERWGERAEEQPGERLSERWGERAEEQPGERLSEQSGEQPGERSGELIIVEKSWDSVKRLEQILDGIVEQALERNNKKLVGEICAAVLQQMEDRMGEWLELRLEELLEERLEESLKDQWDAWLDLRLEEKLRGRLEELQRKEAQGKEVLRGNRQSGIWEAAASDEELKIGKSIKKKWKQWIEKWLGDYR